MSSLEFFLSWPIKLIGIAASIFYGIYAVKIFLSKVKIEKPKQDSDGETATIHFSWRVHQFWLNFLGSFLGWIILYYILKRVNYLEKSAAEDYHYNVSIFDLLSVFLAFTGITGYLPMTIVGLISSISSLAQKIIETMGRYLSK